MLRGRSTQSLMLKWFRIKRLSIQNPLSVEGGGGAFAVLRMSSHGMSTVCGSSSTSDRRLSFLGCGIEGLGVRIQGVGWRVAGLGFRVWN